jgi:cell division protein FtsB
VRSHLPKLENEGLASRNAKGEWEINRSAILALRGHRKGASVDQKVVHQVETSTEWSTLVDALRQNCKGLKDEVEELKAENKQLRAELTELLIKRAKAKDGIISRWIRF